MKHSWSKDTWDNFHKAFFQRQMTKISEKSADNQSEARITVAYNKTVICHWLHVLWNTPQVHDAIRFLPCYRLSSKIHKLLIDGTITLNDSCEERTVRSLHLLIKMIN